jgi:hypothetical protein
MRLCSQLFGAVEDQHPAFPQSLVHADRLALGRVKDDETVGFVDLGLFKNRFVIVSAVGGHGNTPALKAEHGKSGPESPLPHKSIGQHPGGHDCSLPPSTMKPDFEHS